MLHDVSHSGTVGRRGPEIIREQVLLIVVQNMIDLTACTDMFIKIPRSPVFLQIICGNQPEGIGKIR